MTKDRVGRLVSEISQAAGVKVNQSPDGRVKYASAHDLRRSFGERWSSRVMPAVLQQLMRHESIETTMKFYVGRNAQSTAEVLWAAFTAALPNPVDATQHPPARAAFPACSKPPHPGSTSPK